jgi:hypothetical protein
VKNFIASWAYLNSFCDGRHGLDNGTDIYIYNADEDIIKPQVSNLHS